jgi:3-dehydrosphinganine reductase
MWSNGIDDKVIVITGGSSGLGEALAKRLIKRGGCLALVARNEKKLLEVKKQLESENGASGQVEIFRCDVSQAEEVEKTFSAIAEKLGPPSILINSAGILREGYFENLPKDIFRQVMEINFFGALHCIQAIVPLLKKRGGGRVVNISSMAGLIGTFGYTPYCSSKYAVVGLTNALRTELKPQNISFNLVCPTEFDTPMIAEINKTRTVENDSVVHMIPTSTLDEVADAVIKGMEKDRYLIIPGFVTRMSERANRWFPRLTCVTTDSKIRKVYRGPDDSG